MLWDVAHGSCSSSSYYLRLMETLVCSHVNHGRWLLYVQWCCWSRKPSILHMVILENTLVCFLSRIWLVQVDQRHPSVHRKSSLNLQAALPDGMTGNYFKTTDLFSTPPILFEFSVSCRFWSACIWTLQPLNTAVIFLISMSRKHFFGAADEIELKYVNRYVSLPVNNCLMPTWSM